MRAEVIPSHDTTSLYLRWEIVFEGKERDLLKRLGGPLWLEIGTSCYLDPVSGKRFDTMAVRVPIWPHPGERNIGQGRWWDVDSRRRFWVNLQEAVGSRVVDFVHAARLGHVPKEGVTISVPERPGAPDPAPAPAPAGATSKP
jgi:hypothetical protein